LMEQIDSYLSANLGFWCTWTGSNLCTTASIFF
jgi:hypothetical protein